MKRGFAIIAILALAGCNQRGTPIAAYRHLDDKVKAMTGGIFGFPCTRPAKFPDGTQSFEGTDPRDCYRFSAPRRMRGIWINKFEGSNLVENAKAVPPDLFASGSRNALFQYPETREWADIPEGVYRIDLIGRRALQPTYIGRSGRTNTKVLIEHLISLQPVTAPKGSSLDPEVHPPRQYRRLSYK